MKAVIIVPCYNEAGRLDFNQFRQFIESHRDISFLFVNDGSSDDTGAMLRKFCSDCPRAKLFELDKNCGKAEAVRLGMLNAQTYPAEFIGFCDSDLSTPLDEFSRMSALADETRLFISGCRIMRLGSTVRRKLFRHIIGRVFATVVSLHINLPVYDTQCGAKIYNRLVVRNVFQKPFVTKWFFDVEILRRLIKLYGREHVIEHSIEYPLHCWIEKDGSKLRFIAVLSDFLRLLCSRD
jgi:glycosyltransferase involved in cell wall biosynthesis